MKRKIVLLAFLLGTLQFAFSENTAGEKALSAKNSPVKTTELTQRRSTKASSQNRKRGRPCGMIQFLGIGYQEPTYYGEAAAYFESSFIYGYRFSDFLFVGGGIGLEHMGGDFQNDYNLRIPVFGTFKVNMNKKRVSPFFQLDMGYRINSNDYFTDGLFAHPKFGFDFNLGASRRKALFLSLSVIDFGNRNTYYYDGYYGGYHNYYDDENRHISPKIGFNFGLRF